MNKNDTIVACATPYGYGGVAVVRISGLGAVSILKKVTGRTKPFQNRKATLCRLLSNDGTVFDEALVTFFKSPNSYTGEDVGEISCHGSPVVVDALISTCLSHDARMAEPGEFTRRAFENGKMDLMQAEAVAGLIQSKSLSSNRLNQKALNGNLSKEVTGLKEDLIGILSFVEYELDISEEETTGGVVSEISRRVTLLESKVNRLFSSYKEGLLLKKGAKVVIAGKPNAGKSSLLNVLLQTDRAIVNHEPGTTRDSIDAYVLYDGIEICLTDTAGIRDSSDTIEQAGVAKTFATINNSDLVIALASVEDEYGFEWLNQMTSPIIKVVNKIDLLSKEQLDVLIQRKLADMYISTKKNINIEAVKAKIKNALRLEDVLSDEPYLISQRQFNLVTVVKKSLQQTKQFLTSSNPPFELISVEMRSAMDAIDSILGKTTTDDILDFVFNQFCVGK